MLLNVSDIQIGVLVDSPLMEVARDYYAILARQKHAFLIGLKVLRHAFLSLLLSQAKRKKAPRKL